MEKLLSKFNFRGDARICIINGKKVFLRSFSKTIPDIRIDTAIDPKYLYNFILIFADTAQIIEGTAQEAIHNLFEDGILWYAYPKESSGDETGVISRKKGWEACKNAGFEPVRHICIDEKTSATRLRNKKFIKRKN